MKMLLASLVLASLSGFRLTLGQYEPKYVQPQQIHLSYGAQPDQMMVTWVTFDQTESIVRFGVQRPTRHVQGNSSSFQSKESPVRTIWVHRVLLRGLTPGQTYRYNVGSDAGWSALYTFQAMRAGVEWSPRLALYGDLGNWNGRSIGTLQTMAQQGDFDCVVHFGDIAYNMYVDNFRLGDEWFRQIEPIAAYVPYMTSPGNHENAYNFLNYNNRFTNIGLDGQVRNHYHSFNIGPLHVLLYSVEYYYFGKYFNEEDIRRQYEFIVQDLEEATRPENRRLRPWILAVAHRAMYCSTDDTDDCRYVTNRARVGHPQWGYALEPVLHHYGVDFYFAGHEHTYERMLPVYDYKVYNGSSDAPYTNARATIHVIAGSPGCQEYPDQFIPDRPEWSAFRSRDYGFTVMTVHNSTHLLLEQRSVSQNNRVIDNTWVIKHQQNFGVGSSRPYWHHLRLSAAIV